MSDTLTLVLDGTVTLAAYAKALDDFQGLLAALSKEVVAGEDVEWVVSSLATSSAVTTAKGIGNAAAIQVVVGAYENVGEYLERWEPVPFSPAVQKRASGLASLANGKIEAVRFETAERDSIIRQPHGVGVGVPAKSAPLGDTLGVVEGYVETLSRRGGLRFTLYDSLFDKAVSCYIAPGYEDILRDAWGRRAVVFGKVHRDSLTGRPLSVRQVTSLELPPERKKGDWRQARGAVRGLELEAGEAVRRVRDA